MFLISFCNNCIIILLFVKKELNKFTVTKMNILVSKPLKKRSYNCGHVYFFYRKKKKKAFAFFKSTTHLVKK